MEYASGLRPQHLDRTVERGYEHEEDDRVTKAARDQRGGRGELPEQHGSELRQSNDGCRVQDMGEGEGAADIPAVCSKLGCGR